MLRNVNSGAFQVYDILNNQITGAAGLGAVGLDWQLGGFASDPPSSPGAFADIPHGQLVQAMAGFGDGNSGGGAGSNADFADADASQQPLLATAQHA